MWKHDIDDKKIKLLSARLLQAGFAVGRNIDRETGFAEPFGQESRCFLFVLDNENPHGGELRAIMSRQSILVGERAQQSPARPAEM